MIPAPSALSASLINPEQTTVSSPPASSAKRVLVAWNDVSARATLIDKLQSAGLDIDIAPDGELTSEKVHESHPDAILVELPSRATQNGAKLVKELRRYPEFAHLPMYFCAAGPLLPTWKQARATNGGPTKLFNTRLSPLDAIVEELTADLLGIDHATDSLNRRRHPSQNTERLTKAVSTTTAISNPVDGVPPKTLRLMKTENSPTDASTPPALAGVASTVESKNSVNGADASNLNASSSRPRFATFVLRRGGTIHFAYPSGLAMFEWQGEELVGQNLDVLLEGGMKSELQEFLQPPEGLDPKRDKLSIQVTARAKGGLTFPATLTLARIAEHSDFCWTALFRNKLIAATPEQSEEQLQALFAQLADYPAALKKCEEAQKELEEQAQRSRCLEEEVAGLRGLCDDLLGKFSGEPDGSGQGTKELEDQLGEKAAELERTREELAKETTERMRWETESQRLSESGKALESELARLRESGTAARSEVSEPDRRGRDSVAALARATAELERERGERRRIEQRAAAWATQLQELHKQLSQHVESEHSAQETSSKLQEQVAQQQEMLVRLQGELDKQTARRQMMEQQLRTSSDLSVQLRNCISSFEAAKRAFKRTQDELESRLQTAQNAVTESESKCQKELTERQRLEEALANAQRTIHEHAQSALELTKLRCALEVEQAERKCLEGDAAQSRYASMDSARVGLNVLHELRGQLHQPTEAILQSARHLLELPLREDEKQAAESVLENALLLQVTLQETERLDDGSSEADSGAGLA